jgi:hypothetical protein
MEDPIPGKALLSNYLIIFQSSVTNLQIRPILGEYQITNDLLLFGSEELPPITNKSILEAASHYIHQSGRFK